MQQVQVSAFCFLLSALVTLDVSSINKHNRIISEVFKVGNAR